MFFDEYPLFCDTSDTASGKRRLNLRHEGIIQANCDLLQGARVLDLASHDGRWSFAALKAGASHVTGIEARPSLVESANTTLALYGAPSDSYRFIEGDLFSVLDRARLDVDVVLCLGFVYHTLRYAELLRRILDTQAYASIIDTKITPSHDPVVWLKVNDTDVQANAAEDSFSHDHQVIAGWPSLRALELMLNVYQIDIEQQYDWQALLADRPAPAADYRRGERVTLRCRVKPNERSCDGYARQA